MISTAGPTEGLDTRNPLASMGKNRAILLENWIPTSYGVKVREGYREWVTGIPNTVDSLMTFIPNSYAMTTKKVGLNSNSMRTSLPAGSKLFAATSLHVYDVTNSMNAPPSVYDLSGQTGAGIIQSVQFTGAAGVPTLCCCSETDGYFIYTQAAGWKKVTTTDVTGADPAKFCFVTAWKNQLLFIERNTTKMWFLPVNNITGAVKLFDFGPQFKKGGYLYAVASWTIDAGEGIDDLLVVLSSQGDLVVYKGNDPSNPSNFGLVGIYYVGKPPLGRRAMMQDGGDVLVLCDSGLVPVSFIVRGSQAMLTSDVSPYMASINPYFMEIMAKYGGQFGFSIAEYQRENLLLIATPDPGNRDYSTAALDSTTKGWCLLKGIPIRCMIVFDGDFYFGTTDGRVCLGFNGDLDNVKLNPADTSNDPILARMQLAYSDFGGGGINKRYLMVRPTFMAPYKPVVSVLMNTDFEVNLPTTAPAFIAISGDVWDEGVWDEARWAGQKNNYHDWLSVNAVGVYGSLALIYNGPSNVLLTSIDYLVEPGGPL